MAHTSGPESPTLVERFVALFRLPHILGCVILVTLFFTLAILAPTLALYVRTGDFSATLIQLSSFIQVGGLLFGFLFFYTLYAPHYIREKIVQAEDLIEPMLPGGEADFHKLFGRISSIRRQLLLWVGFFSFFLIGFIQPSTLQSPALLQNLLASMLFSGIFSFGISQVVWTYVYSLRGIHKIGSSPLNLKPYYVDRLLGLRPAASLALSIAVAYFASVGIMVALSLANPAPPLGILLMISGLIILGILMFFLPLRRLHERMTKQKKLEREKIESRLVQVFETPTSPGSSSYPPASLELTLDAIRLDIMKREIASIAIWPFDFQILGKFTIIILSVVAALLARYIGSLLNL